MLQRCASYRCGAQNHHVHPAERHTCTAGELTGREIPKLIEASLESTYSGDPLCQKGGYPIRTSGLSALVRINNPHNSRVLQLDIAGEQDIRQVESRRPCGIHAVDALREYVQRHKPVDPTRFGSRIVVSE